MGTRDSQPARWRTSWWLLSLSLLFAVCAFSVTALDRSEASAFEHSSHEVSGTVVVSDCWVLCKGGPDVEVAYTTAGGVRARGELDDVDRRYHVGDMITVIYSDRSGASGWVLTSPQSERVGDLQTSSWSWFAAAVVALCLAFAAWAFPANLRRTDRRDAKRAAQRQ